MQTNSLSDTKDSPIQTKQLLQEPTRKTNTTQNLYSVKTLLALLHRKHLTQPQIVEQTGLVNSTVSRWLGALHSKPENLVYIASWKRTGSRGCYSAVWASGYCLEDAPKPLPLTASQYAKRWRKSVAREDRTIEVKPGVIKHVSK